MLKTNFEVHMKYFKAQTNDEILPVFAQFL